MIEHLIYCTTVFFSELEDGACYTSELFMVFAVGRSFIRSAQRLVLDAKPWQLKLDEAWGSTAQHFINSLISALLIVKCARLTGKKKKAKLGFLGLGKEMKFRSLFQGFLDSTFSEHNMPVTFLALYL